MGGWGDLRIFRGGLWGLVFGGLDLEGLEDEEPIAGGGGLVEVVVG